MNDFDDIISGAVTGRADGAPTDAPDFETVLAVRQDRLRRRTALAAGGLVVAGLAGIGLFATAGDDTPGVAGAPSSTMAGPFSTTTIAPDRFGGEVWFCTGRLDVSADGTPSVTVLETLPPTTMQASTTTIPPGENPDLVTETTLWPEEDSGYFQHCSLVGNEVSPSTTMIDGITVDPSPPLTTIEIGSEEARIAEEARIEEELEARNQAEELQRRAASEIEARRLAEEGIATHIVEDGDDAILIAERNCVSLSDLLNFNGWTSGAELPFPGDLVMIPPSTVTDCPLPPPTTTGG